MENLTHGSLFSGIGGFDIGATRQGIKTLWNCELNSKSRTILKKISNAKQYGDIRKLSNAEYVDIISGGFPCQDISVAGSMEGINGSRSGLWSEMFRVCREVRPKYIIIENSPALLIRGFEKVLCDLSKIGYCCEWQCISNKSFGYPHSRERVYAIAYTNLFNEKTNVFKHGNFKSIFQKWTSNFDSAYSLSKRIYEMRTCESVRNGNGFQDWTYRVGSLGNAVNPTLTEYLFKCIKDFNSSIQNN